MVRRIYVEKRAGFDNFRKKIQGEIFDILGVKAELRVFLRYDVEDIGDEVFEAAKSSVFSEPPADIVYDDVEFLKGARVLVTEYLDGQFDQRAASAAECVALLSGGERPLVRCATVFAFFGISDSDFLIIKKHLINPVESREGSAEIPLTLKAKKPVKRKMREELSGFISLSAAELKKFSDDFGFAMTLEDLKFVQDYFKSENREPTVTELKILDTYWSDHCRHTTFLTELTDIEIESENPHIKKSLELYRAIFAELYKDRPDKYPCLMDIATIGTKKLKAMGYLKNHDESEEVNACSIKVAVAGEGGTEDWLIMFKNETHNHPTEIEPFGGAATCLGGAIRDPLSGRAYVYQAMRITGGGNPFLENTLKGKLPQRVITKTALAGFSSYGNQIGLATGKVQEFYHEGYVAKRLEAGFVIAGAPAANVIRKRPSAGDVVILVGGDTGRDGCGGATGSSRAHTEESVELCGAEVQKGNAPEERKLMRLFKNPEAARLIIRCNDFGAGGVAVAIGELAEGIDIRLDLVPKKYEGLTATELAISESQERMAVVVKASDAEKFAALAGEENLKATTVAEITDLGRLRMFYDDEPIADIARSFLDTNGVRQQAEAKIQDRGQNFFDKIEGDTLLKLKTEGYQAALSNELKKLKNCSQKGLGEVFDSTIGAASALLPFGGRHMLTESTAMAAKPPVDGDTDTVTVAACGLYPEMLSASPYIGAIYSVIGAVSKLVASGVKKETIYLSLQEYFKRLGRDKTRWGEPAAALLGALDAELGLKIGAIGGKDSMSGSFENIDVPPTLIGFAVGVTDTKKLTHNAFSDKGYIYRFKVKKDEFGEPDYESLLSLYNEVYSLISADKVLNSAVVEHGFMVALAKSLLGNMAGAKLYRIGFDMFKPDTGDIILITKEKIATEAGELLGELTSSGKIEAEGVSVALSELSAPYTATLEPIFKTTAAADGAAKNADFNVSKTFKSKYPTVKPRVFIPVFPGTNCEYDTAKKFIKAGAIPDIFVLKNLKPADVEYSAREFQKRISNAQIIAFPGGFSGGDEPDGSGKFIAVTIKNPLIKKEILSLLYERDGLILGICNGFQALIKTGLLPFGVIEDLRSDSPTLTFNTISRHVSTIVKIRISSNASPWLSGFRTGETFYVPVSNGEGRFVAPEATMEKLIAGGQIATQYCDETGNATMASPFNPSGSMMAVEGLISPCGRVFGKMGHSERTGKGLYKNFPGNFDMDIFANGVNYFK
jgi:phosphoribosylformylglycinamidine synthase